MPRGGNPNGTGTKLTKTIQDKICSAIAQGVPFKHACAAQGIGESTAYEKIKTDERFAEAVTRARGQAVVFLHQKALDGERGSGAAMFMLERRFRDDYGAHQKIEHSGPDGGAIVGEIRNMSTEELAKLAAQRRSSGA